MSVRRKSGGLRRDGFSLVELLIVTVLASLVIAAAFRLFISQSRLFMVQREILDARESVRSASALLAADLRELASTDADLYSAESDSIVLRSMTGAGVVCAHTWQGPDRRLALQHTSGTFQAVAATDSVLAYRLAADVWGAYPVTEVWTPPAAWLPSGGNTSTCFWGDSSTTVPRPEVTVELTGPFADLGEIVPGSPVRSFRRTKYALFQRNSRWFLGRKVGSALGYELLTGPMLSPTDGGFQASYYDAAGVATTVPADVVRIELMLKSESAGRTTSGTQVDSLTTTVFLRNN